MLREIGHTAIATHDDKLIEHAIAFAEREGIERDRFEFQMLYGIRGRLQEELVARGLQGARRDAVRARLVPLPHAPSGRTPGEPHLLPAKLGRPMTQTSARFATVPPSGIREIFDLALTIPDAIHLEIGAPDFPTPDHIVEAAAQAARDGFTRYTPTGGLGTLRELLADKVRRRNGMNCAVENVVAAAGGCCAIFAALEVLLDDGDGVLIPDPAWPVYEMATLSLGGEVQRYPLHPETGFEPDLEALEAAITSRTRVLVTNSPGNPTGGVHRRETVEALLALAEKHDLWLLSDEAYEDFVFEGEHVTTGSLDGAAKRVIGVYTFSKTYSMTGWRMGYLVGPEPIMKGVTIALEPLIACPSSVSQKAAEAALAGPQDNVGGDVRGLQAAPRSRRGNPRPRRRGVRPPGRELLHGRARPRRRRCERVRVLAPRGTPRRGRCRATPSARGAPECCASRSAWRTPISSAASSCSPSTPPGGRVVIRGALAASVTPLRDGGDAVDQEAIAPLVDFYADAGLDGLLVLGTTGEGILFSPDERRVVTERFVESGNGRLALIIHTGAQTTADTVALAAHAAETGADGVAVIGPPYFAYDDDSLLAHFAAAADAAAPLPFYVYEFAARAGYPVPLAVLARLRDTAENFVGLKVSNAPYEAFAPYLAGGPGRVRRARVPHRPRPGRGRGRRGLGPRRRVSRAGGRPRARAERGGRRARHRRARRAAAIPVPVGAQARPGAARRAGRAVRPRPAAGPDAA